MSNTAMNMVYYYLLGFRLSILLVIHPEMELLSHLGMLRIYIFFETGSCCVAQADLKLSILLPQPSECWDHRYVLPYPGLLGLIFQQ
jgi:hypothetical protein